MHLVLFCTYLNVKVTNCVASNILNFKEIQKKIPERRFTRKIQKRRKFDETNILSVWVDMHYVCFHECVSMYLSVFCSVYQFVCVWKCM